MLNIRLRLGAAVARGYRQEARSSYDRGANRGGLQIIAAIASRRLGAVARVPFCILTLAAGSDAAGAAPFDFLFGGPPPTARMARSRRRPAPRPPMAEVPLPPPRPHFPGEPPAVAAEIPRADRDRAGPPAPAAAPPQAPTAPADAPAPTPGKSAEMAKAPAESAGRPPETPAAGAAPLPPPKPAEMGKPESPPTAMRPVEAAKPAERAPETHPPAAAPTAPNAPGAALPAQPPTPPPKPADVGKPSTVAPSGATTAFTPRAPEDNPQCPGALAARHVEAPPTPIGPQPDARCTVVEPVRLTKMTLADGAAVAFPDRPTIACTTADSFSAFVRDLLVPLAKGTFGSPVTAVWTGPGLECRSRDSVFGAKLSAHGQGLAIDIAQLKLADGRIIEVGTPKTDAETGFETAARAGACGYFHTVLGPGSDSYHRTHWHFDLEVRGAHGDSKYCK